MKRPIIPIAFTVFSLGFGATAPRALGIAPENVPQGESDVAAGSARATTERDPSRRLPAQMGATKVMPDSVFGPDAALPEPRPMESKGPAAQSFRRNTLSQPQCSICLEGSESVQWAGGGTSGSFHVDTISNNRASGTSGSLELRMVLTAALPVWGQSTSPSGSRPVLEFSDGQILLPLPSGHYYSPVDSGTVRFFGSSIPAGEYFHLMLLRENVSGTMLYADWSVMSKKVLCDGTACHSVTTAGCTEDAYTMCLVNGRYQVQSAWRNQYATPITTTTLSKTKLTDTTGAFWIADANTYEYMIRFNTVTDNGRAWISIPMFTDVEFYVYVTDTVNGQSAVYHSPAYNRTLIYDPLTFVFP
jgi:hypothetical protein